MSGRSKRKVKKAKVRGFSPEAEPPHAPAEASSSTISEDPHYVDTQRIKVLAGGGFRVSNPVTRAPVPLHPDPLYSAPPVTDVADVSSGVPPWNDILSYGTEEDYFSYLLEIGQTPQKIAENSEKEEKAGDQAMHEWVHHIDTYLQVMIGLEGRNNQCDAICTGCDTNPALYRCLGCDVNNLSCHSCMVLSHTHQPLHQIKMWNGSHFVKATLKELGLRIQLGHRTGETCQNPLKATNDDFVIVDYDQIHEVGLDYCGCGATNKDQTVQLLERRFYPATTTNPKTAATFRVLEVFEMLQYEAKVSVFEFYQTIARLTDNTGLNEPKNRYTSMLRMAHEWRHLKLLKRSGRGHDPNQSAQDAQEGECAVLCPACPHPDINMRVGWEDDPDDKHDKADPGLSHGFAYFVEETKFKQYLAQHAGEVEPKSTCSRHDAVNSADTRPGQGYAATGVATVECARHNMKRPLGVGDLQRGERYCNIDYLLRQSIGDTKLKRFLLSYDICCQWSQNLFKRLQDVQPNFHLLGPRAKCRFVVPKFHLPAHIQACRTQYAFMHTPGAGLGDGEAPERGWGDSNPLATSTREMGPGSRRDTLDYNFGDYNWKKIMRLDKYLLRRMSAVTHDAPEQVIAYKELEEIIDEALLTEWKIGVEAWERDPQNPNPFEFRVATPTQAAIRREIAEDQARKAQEGGDAQAGKRTTPLNLLTKGFEIEKAQRELKKLGKDLWEHSQDRALLKFRLKSDALILKIEDHYQTLESYIPSTVELRKSRIPVNTVAPYDLPLWFPSEIGKLAPFDLELGRLEFKLREAQAHEALGKLRRALQRRATQYDSKDRWARGQGMNTRSLASIASLQADVDESADEYRKAHDALTSLSTVLSLTVNSSLLTLNKQDIRSMPVENPQDEVQRTLDLTRRLRQLEETDIRAIDEPEEGRGNTRRTVSWIWRQGEISAETDPYTIDLNRVEWAKSRARARRYEEEIDLLQEEMARTLRFLLWKRDWWKLKAGGHERRGFSGAVVDGMSAYSFRQASLWQQLHDSFEKTWEPVQGMIDKSRSLMSNAESFYEWQKADMAEQHQKKGVKRSRPVEK
ncbi:hypothetical protein EST38_g10274 [Candolleomyces aberdarensis]|uniref:CxC2-like cysteine cluster KDZ transposase-associated domain-containing protein n=1 Tax=Candolleomyces aberdarensis TaxID=2316362 RepID=A0A4Q2DA02_9AGAR|nr:hypothetical protein EST38_g10274 [Candolleomyces aberdarensis]